MNRGVLQLLSIPYASLLVVAAGCGIAALIGELAWGVFASGIALLLLALPRDEPREHQAEAVPYGLKGATATFVMLSLGLALIAFGVFRQVT
jgi:hypothetical protein